MVGLIVDPGRVCPPIARLSPWPTTRRMDPFSPPTHTQSFQATMKREKWSSTVERWYQPQPVTFR
jgi:hypothetical protein